MDKIYLTADELLKDSFKLAEKIYQSGFRPDFIVGVWRGGTPIGIAVHEYFDYLGFPTNHMAIRTSLYEDIGKQGNAVGVHGIEYLLDNIDAEDELLLVDDVFDTGKSMQAILSQIAHGTHSAIPHTIKIAMPWYKPTKNMTNIKPDFYLHETDKWLVFPHELKGLTPAEISRNKPDMADTIVRHIEGN